MTDVNCSQGLLAADRGVSEVVGFVLVFALITSTIAVTFTVGLGGLEDAQLAERDNNVERAFDVLHDNLNDISRDGVPSRATEVRLAGGSIELSDPVRLRATVDGTESSVLSLPSRPIEYSGAGNTKVVYENGAVFRSDGSNAVMVNEPDLLVGETTVFSIVDVRAASGTSRLAGGDRTVLLVSERHNREMIVADGENVTLTHEASPRADAWEQYYEDLSAEYPDRIAVGCDEDAASVECDEDTVSVTITVDERVIIHTTEIRTTLGD
ncbi:hypothetical protein J2751_001081 [Halorubrum alkaliphilum]|uniref:Uncharacterized protein n=1 Tax=Halorubrum alkaliphilum TaxID=261290 RepID=A0A8T4GD70_9EURY|nr:hypothetical protein [Halorubrum alkaliphilum]MBP1922076.1 hypothetical protein [Halorubrum alkaliphilum]